MAVSEYDERCTESNAPALVQKEILDNTGDLVFTEAVIKPHCWSLCFAVLAFFLHIAFSTTQYTALKVVPEAFDITVYDILSEMAWSCEFSYRWRYFQKHGSCGQEEWYKLSKKDISIHAHKTGYNSVVMLQSKKKKKKTPLIYPLQ